MFAAEKEDVVDGKRHCTVGVQTDYRETSVQTEPYEPEYRLSKTKHAHPTLLRLRGIRAKDQERTCLEEIREEEDIEERLAREGTDLSDLERIELRERWKWMAKEEKLKKRQAAKMARFTKELEEREATKEAYLARRTEERVIAREKTSGRTQDRREKLRFWRDPQTRRWLEDPLSVKTPLIDAFARVTSSLHCPRLRDGALLPSKPSKRGNVEENVSYKSTASLEKRLERSWTENVPEPIRKPSRQTLQIANDIDRVCVAIKEDSTQEVDADEKMRLATKPHEHGDGPSGTAQHLERSTSGSPSRVRTCCSIPYRWGWGRRYRARIDCFSKKSCERTIGACSILDGELIDGTTSYQLRRDLHLICVAVKGFHSQPPVSRFIAYRSVSIPATFTMATVFTTTKVLTPMTSKAAPSPSSLKPASQPKNAFFARTVSNGCKVRQLRTWTPTNNKYIRRRRKRDPMIRRFVSLQILRDLVLPAASYKRTDRKAGRLHGQKRMDALPRVRKP